ncbi:TonB-dependent receptor [Capnocytophaga sp. oral taxon 878]|uniref:SusC/RagA family TonB-linked outer membrane protein n=1 Tax=Capnocytophaga sp. oral taxon 878 TaxID=1316596 RepID=UPI000D022ECE|nr:TonB-dependent receptor [Capnocytophaga sp. oral taxon 878]AVM50148.1 SusC/RagA family TonB-linked outer membrane protein [Capnocytophaga sp. oral taxon 878]
MKRKVLTLLMALWGCLPLLWAQNKQISGTVTDESGTPIASVSVQVKGTTRGVATDLDGKYTIDAEQNNTLIFSSVGYITQEKNVNGGGKSLIINVLLKEDTQQLSEVVVVGYGVQKKENLTGAVAAVTSEMLTKRPVANTTTMLQGQVPGLRIVQGTGQPGAESASMRVRGQGTYSSAGSDPLVLIDGVPGSINNINPNDIENVSVLKDAASASIYGARAANGVILVTTKLGSDGHFKIAYQNNFGMHTPTRMLDLVTNSAEYMRLFNEAKANSGITTGLYTQQMINAYENATDRTQYPNFDWVDYMFNPAFVQNHNLTLSGGAKGTNYNIALGYVDQPGVLRGFKYDRLNFRSNVKSEIKPWATVGVNVALDRGKTEQPRQGHVDTFLSTIAQAPTYRPFTADGKYVSKAYDFEEANKNMPAIIDSGALRKITEYNLSGQLWDDITLLKGLNWYSKLAVTYSDSSYKDWRPVAPVYNYHTGLRTGDLDVGGRGLVSNNAKNFYTNFFSYLKYEKTFGQHTIGLQAGYSQEYNNYQTLQGYRRNYNANNLHELNAGTASDQTNSGNTVEWALQSFFGRFNYNYKERYLLEANVRYDGTSRISKDNRWGWFPSFSAGWRVSEESFIKDAESMNWLNNFKLRGSYGLLGNQNIGNYPYQSLLSYTGAYPFDNITLFPGAAQTEYANADIKWESTSVADIGVDINLFNRITIVYDWYKKHTFDILRNSQVTGALGLSAPTVNSGEMENYGHELSVQYNHTLTSGKLEGLSYGAGFFIDISRNKLVNFGAREIDGFNVRENGLPYNSFYMLKMIGVFQNQTEIDNSPKQFNDPVRPGDFKYEDINHDGKIDNNDRTVVDGRFPKYDYSFNAHLEYKGIDFSVLFQGVEGRKIYTTGWGLDPFRQGTAPTRDFVNNRWTGEGSTNSYPRMYFNQVGDSHNRRNNTWYLQDASYLRLKNITLGYSFSDDVISKIGLTKLRVYFSGDNLWTITNYKGLDPERAGDGLFVQYPQNKIVSMGLNVEF